MDAKQIKLIVDDFPQWSGNTYKLAALVAEKQRDSDAELLEAEGQQELADKVRGN
jgi:hypothetical protein